MGKEADRARNESLKKLTLRGQAVFRFLEFIAREEKRQSRRLAFWDGGVETQEKLSDFLKSGDEWELPIPEIGEAISFGFKVPRGMFEMRLLGKGEGCLSLAVNIGFLDEGKEIWRAAFEREPFPVEIQDWHDSRFVNEAYLKKFGNK